MWAELTEHHRRLYDDPSIGGDEPGAYFDEYLNLPEWRASWVAVVDSEVVGLTGLFDQGDRCEIEPVVVAERHRGTGIGRALVGFAVDDARRRGYVAVALRPVARNADAIRAFHALGFTVLGGHVDLALQLQPPTSPPRPGGQLHGLDFDT